jgi:pSer/pThr/pTyr-binding forkhead associated (FHA) protein
MTDLVRTVTVGSSATNHIHITGDPFVSLHHCRLDQYKNGKVLVTDLGSTNGTFIKYDGNPIAKQVFLPMAISPGDILIVGNTWIPWSKR